MPPSIATETSYMRELLQNLTSLRSTSSTESLINALKLQPHPEGGYFVETDRDHLLIPNPFCGTKIYPNATVKQSADTETDDTPTRNASTTIHYYLDPARPFGVFYRNKGRTVHTHHHGRGLYIVIHADEVQHDTASRARIETFIVGPDIQNGERIQWIVEGGKFKASILLPDHPHRQNSSNTGSEKGLLISGTVVPGFDFMDHDFLAAEEFKFLLGNEQSESDLSRLLRENRKENLD